MLLSTFTYYLDFISFIFLLVIAVVVVGGVFVFVFDFRVFMLFLCFYVSRYPLSLSLSFFLH